MIQDHTGLLHSINTKPSTQTQQLNPSTIPYPLTPVCRCVFLPDNGAFFVNYVITASLLGTAMELLRVPALVVYALRLCLAKSQAERIHIRRVRVSVGSLCSPSPSPLHPLLSTLSTLTS